MRIIFFGADRWFSGPVLEAILKVKHQVVLMVTKGDALKNFRFKISDLRFMEAKTSEDISLARLDSLLRSDPPAGGSDLSRPDAIVLASFGPPFLPAEVLNWPKYGCLNVHASLLPRWRGASPVFAALAAGDKETGVSIMRMTEEIDRGPVLGQKKTLIKSGVSWLKLTRSLLAEANKESPCFDNRKTMTKRLGKLGGKLIVETLKKLEIGQIIETPQPKKSPTPYTRRLTKESGRIDWSQSPIEIERFIRAVTPWPGAWTEYRAKGQRLKAKSQTIKILKAHLEKFLQRDCRGRLRRPRNDVTLIIDEVQLPGKTPITWKQFLAGHPAVELK